MIKLICKGLPLYTSTTRKFVKFVSVKKTFHDTNKPLKVSRKSIKHRLSKYIQNVPHVHFKRYIFIKKIQFDTKRTLGVRIGYVYISNRTVWENDLCVCSLAVSKPDIPSLFQPTDKNQNCFDPTFFKLFCSQKKSSLKINRKSCQKSSDTLLYEGKNQCFMRRQALVVNKNK